MRASVPSVRIHPASARQSGLCGVISGCVRTLDIPAGWAGAPQSLARNFQIIRSESTYSPRQSLLVNFQYPCGRPRDGFGNEQRPVRSLVLGQVAGCSASGAPDQPRLFGPRVYGTALASEVMVMPAGAVPSMSAAIVPGATKARAARIALDPVAGRRAGACRARGLSLGPVRPASLRTGAHRRSWAKRCDESDSAACLTLVSLATSRRKMSLLPISTRGSYPPRSRLPAQRQWLM
jgi:hypothetical protein